ncbi:MAG: hypothetical protein IPK50_10600 [Fibrobacterota bacterium]|nr:hypothetical protein [Fibrobacterota bacterium]QQS07326.1 MAG: hypothetical protein IPK50_10600 [Fibrobacterota bacterium]
MKAIIFAALSGVAIHAEVPNTFKPNEPARAAEVNQNFKHLDSAVATKANKAPLDLAIESLNQKASKTDLDSRLESGVFTTFQKKMATDSTMLEGKIKATASSAQVKTDLDAIRADVATKAATADLKAAQTDISKISTTVGGLASSSDVAKLKDAVGAKADTTSMKAAQGDIAALKSSVSALANTSELAKTQTELASLTKTVGAKADTTPFKAAQADIASLKSSLSTKANTSDLSKTQTELAALAKTVGAKADTTALKTTQADLAFLNESVVKHATMQSADASFDNPPYGSSFATISSAISTPFGATSAAWYNLISLRHRNGGGDGNVYGGQIAWGMTAFEGRLAFRTQSGKWTSWTEVMTKGSLTAANLPGGPYLKESTALSVDPAGVVHMAALKVHSDIQTPDYVFAPDYKLAPLAEVEAFTQENQHLPDVPSAAEIEKGGLDLAKMNLALLRKVEELTLHAISQEKRIQSLETEIKTLR